MMGKTIGLTYDLKEDWVFHDQDPQDANAEFDRPNTVSEVEKALKSYGHIVKRIGNVYSLLEKIDHLDVDLVLNLCEGISGRNRESQVPIDRPLVQRHWLACCRHQTGPSRSPAPLPA